MVGRLMKTVTAVEVEPPTFYAGDSYLLQLCTARYWKADSTITYLSFRCWIRLLGSAVFIYRLIPEVLIVALGWSTRMEYLPSPEVG